MIVLDASALLEFLLGTPRGEEVGVRLEDMDGRWHAPDLVDLEVTQVLRRWEASGALDPERAQAAVELLVDLPLVRHGARALVPRIWGLRANLSAYDAAYVALAEGLEAPMLTCDERLARAPGHRAAVRLVP